MRDLPSLLLTTSETEVFCLISFFFLIYVFKINFYWSIVAFTASGSDGKESACNAGDLGSVSGLGRSPGEGDGHPLHYSCLGKSLLGYSPWGCKKLGMTEQLTHTHSCFTRLC